LEVSILARLFGRALPPDIEKLDPDIQVSILARLFGRALQDTARHNQRWN